MVVRTLILSLCFLCVAGYISQVSRAEPVLVRAPLSGFPTQIGSWRGQDAPDFDAKVLDALGVDDYLNRVYSSKDGKIVSVYAGFYRSQRQGSSIHSPMNCLPGAGWNPTERSVLSIPVETQAGGQREIEVNRIIIEKGAQKQLVLYWYQSHGRIIANEYIGKMYTVLDAIRVNRTDAALMRFVSPIQGESEESEGEAETAAVDLVKHAFPLMSRFLPD
jgi:EpsI family protein